jgi:hypothetical protein
MDAFMLEMILLVTSKARNNGGRWHRQNTYIGRAGE